MIEHHASLIAKSLLGEPNERFSKGTELRWGNFGSLSVDLEKATYFDHEVGSGGGLVDLIRREGKDPMTYLTELGIEGEKPQTPSGPRINNGLMMGHTAQCAALIRYIDKKDIKVGTFEHVTPPPLPRPESIGRLPHG